MCGIFAVIQTELIWSPDKLWAATNSMTHRGPDECGYWSSDGAFLGHRRLSIIDLVAGKQPMESHDGRYVVVFNGEIYNFRELRESLQGHGHHFRTMSDTEVILESYRRWGNGCLRQLEGMFAFLLWDKTDRKVLAARDRLGIKPLCWATYRGSLIVASTLEPFLCLEAFRRELDFEALRDVMVFDYIPAPRTILCNVKKLMPGHRMTWTVHQTEPRFQSYWDIPGPVGREWQREEIIEKVEYALRAAIKRQMVSDVPVGAFLSGGIDSSLSVAFMSECYGRPVKTFSVSFQEAELDESGYAATVASLFETEHATISGETILGEDVIEIIQRLDEPFSDPTMIPTYLVSEFAGSSVKVVLSGDGGDEVFGGYAKYLMSEDLRKNPWLPYLRPIKRLIHCMPLHIRGAGVLYGKTLTPHEYVPYSWTHYGDYPVFREDLALLFSRECYPRIFAFRFFDPWLQHAKKWGEKFTADLLMRVDLQTYLSENCLVKTDRMSMLNSLEVRVPFLDELVLNLMVPLPAEVKILDRQLKSLILPVAQRHLPREIWGRPKHGFTIPLGKYMAKQWSSEVASVLEWGKKNVPFFNYNYLFRLTNMNHRSQSIGRELWSPFVFLAWWRSHCSQISVN